MIWFNPPFCKLSNINIGKYFLNSVDNDFQKNNTQSNIFHINTLKFSYSCSYNISKEMKYHNKKNTGQLKLRK